MCGCPSTVNRNNSNHCPACHHVQQSMYNMMHWAISKVSSYLRKSMQYEASHCADLTVLHLSPNTLLNTPFNRPSNYNFCRHSNRVSSPYIKKDQNHTSESLLIPFQLLTLGAINQGFTLEIKTHCISILWKQLGPLISPRSVMLGGSTS